MCRHEQTRGCGGMLPWENLTFNSFEMGRNASKIANNNVNFLNFTST